jgi:putative FmdB family regulatory protein
MPTYTYRCLDCQRHFEIFLTYAEYDQTTVHCPHCNSKNVDRRIEKIRIAKSEESRLEDIADPSQLEGIEEDPVAMGRMMRRMGEELGEEVGPEFDEVVSRLEKGEDPEKIARDIPDIGGMDEGLGDTDF